jgi:hypothetical protein
VDFFDAIHYFDVADVEIHPRADRAQHGLELARAAMHLEAQLHQPLDHGLDLLFRCLLLHCDDHLSS